MRMLLLGIIAFQVGCVGPDLGDAPFLCNDGYPQCPDGYHCVVVGDDNYCVKEGLAVGETGTPGHDGSTSGPGLLDGAIPGDDSSMADTSIPKKPDIKITTDVLGKPDILPWKACQNNSDCKATTYKCCCKVFLLSTMVCLPVCPDPYCI